MLLLSIMTAIAGPDRCLAGDVGNLLEYSVVHELNIQDGQDLWNDYEFMNLELGYISQDEPFVPQYNVTAYRAIYCTADRQDSDGILEDSEVVEAGATVVVPDVSETHMPAIYYIGTEIARGSVVSVSLDPSLVYEGQTALLQYSMSAGLPLLIPNGPGFDGSELSSDWYFVSDIYADYGFALIEAAAQIPEFALVADDSKLYVSGFSAGAHNALALARKLEDLQTPPTAIGVVEGVYDVETWTLDLLTTHDSPLGFLSLYMADLAYTAQRSDAVGSMNFVFDVPYRNTIPHHFDGTGYYWTVEPQMPTDPQDLFTWYFYYWSVYSPCSSYRSWLRDQNVNDYVPSVDMLIIHSDTDEEVDVTMTDAYVNSLTGASVDYQRVSGTDHLTTWHTSWSLLVEDAQSHN